MNIEFDHGIPNPLKEFIQPQSIWNQPFTFNSGQMYQIIAPSGKGKSTLVGLLAGTRGDFLGKVLFEGQNSIGFSPSQWSQWRALQCSVLFQDLQLFPALTALENILLTREINQIHANNGQVATWVQTEETIQKWAMSLGIQEKLNQPVAKLSFGQMQRVAILRALNRPFSWLVLDEPFSHLDQTNSNNAMELIQEVANAQKAGVIITSLDERYSVTGFSPVTI